MKLEWTPARRQSHFNLTNEGGTWNVPVCFSTLMYDEFLLCTLYLFVVSIPVLMKINNHHSMPSTNIDNSNDSKIKNKDDTNTNSNINVNRHVILHTHKIMLVIMIMILILLIIALLIIMTSMVTIKKLWRRSWL